MFMEIFGTGIETILVCFIADEEMFPAGERFADGELVEVIDKTAQATQVKTTNSRKIFPFSFGGRDDESSNANSRPMSRVKDVVVKPKDSTLGK